MRTKQLRPRDIYIVAAAASLLLVVVAWFEGPAAPYGILAYHLLPVALLWAGAWLLAQRSALLEELARREQELEDRVAARTAELALSEERYRLLAENGRDIVWTLDLAGRVTYLSPSVERMLGCSPEEVMQMTWDQRAGTGNGVRVAADIRAALEALRRGEPVASESFVVSLQHKDGRTIWTETVVGALRDGAGRPTGFCGSTRDITIRHTAQEALRRSEERFGKLFHTTPAGILVGRLSDLRIVDANDAYMQMSGFTREELVGRTVIELGILSPEVHRTLLAKIRESGPPRDLELKVHNKAGEATDVLYSSEVIELDGETCFLAAIHDISMRKRLAARANRLAAVVEAAYDAIASFDLDGTIITVNRSTEELYHIQAAAVLGQNLFTLVPPEYVDPLRETLAQIRRGEVIKIDDAAWPLVDGTTMIISLTLSPIYDDQGQVTAFTSIGRDITPRKRAEEALQHLNAELEDRVAQRTADLEAALADLQRANRLKDEFMAMISHELRTPLTGVLSMAELLADGVAGPLNARQGGYVKGISESGERLLHVISGILSYTHLLSGRFQLRREPCELRCLLDTCAASQQYKTAAKAQTVLVQVEPADLAITSDASALVEVLKRLLDNASRFTPAGGRIGLEARRSFSADAVDLVVWDTGTGIDPEQLAHIFKPFTQADGSLARRHDGVGLGLAYVDQMVHLLGGTLAVTSDAGSGSRFTITLPVGA